MNVARYNVLPCPDCGTVAFSLTSEGWRKCWGCGHAWDSGSAGREVIGWRGPSNGFMGGKGFRPKVHREIREQSSKSAL